MNEDRSYPDIDAISEEEQEHDSRIGAKMHLFLERMVGAAIEEEKIDAERAVDLMLCAAVQFYAERHPTTPLELAQFCRAIAEEALSGADDVDTLH
jgi:hypothetical protein